MSRHPIASLLGVHRDTRQHDHRSASLAIRQLPSIRYDAICRPNVQAPNTFVHAPSNSIFPCVFNHMYHIANLLFESLVLLLDREGSFHTESVPDGKLPAGNHRQFRCYCPLGFITQASARGLSVHRRRLPRYSSTDIEGSMAARMKKIGFERKFPGGGRSMTCPASNVFSIRWVLFRIIILQRQSYESAKK